MHAIAEVKTFTLRVPSTSKDSKNATIQLQNEEVFLVLLLKRRRLLMPIFINATIFFPEILSTF